VEMTILVCMETILVEMSKLLYTSVLYENCIYGGDDSFTITYFIGAVSY
jgi:hypothetical protein